MAILIMSFVRPTHGTAAVQFDTAMEQAKSTSAKVTPELVG